MTYQLSFFIFTLALLPYPCMGQENDIWDFKHTSKPAVFRTFDFQICLAPKRHAFFRFQIAIKSSKNDPNPKCVNTFDFKICFAPQPCVLFQSSISKSSLTLKCFENVYLKFASLHNGVHFFHISVSKSRNLFASINSYLALPQEAPGIQSSDSSALSTELGGKYDLFSNFISKKKQIKG